MVKWVNYNKWITPELNWSPFYQVRLFCLYKQKTPILYGFVFGPAQKKRRSNSEVPSHRTVSSFSQTRKAHRNPALLATLLAEIGAWNSPRFFQQSNRPGGWTTRRRQIRKSSPRFRGEQMFETTPASQSVLEFAFRFSTFHLEASLCYQKNRPTSLRFGLLLSNRIPTPNPLSM